MQDMASCNRAYVLVGCWTHGTLCTLWFMLGGKNLFFNWQKL